MSDPKHFPDHFWWGTATAGHQVEGNNTHSNWWQWEKLGLVNDHTTSGRACDYWNRWPGDHALMAELGHNGFRMGLEWARIEPDEGQFDQTVIDQYVAMLADLRQRGLQVCLTLNHWVVPQWFTDAGSWTGPHALDRWERFVRTVVPQVAPHVNLWVTLNEPMVPVLAGHLAGYHPPGKRNPLLAAKVFRRLLDAHAIAYHAIHELAPNAPDGGPTMAGYAAAYQWVEPFHDKGWQRPLESAISRLVSHISYRGWDTAIKTGKVPFPFGFAQRIAALRDSTDFIGVNYYMRVSVRLHPSALSNVASGEYDAPEGIETTEMGWQIYPPGFRQALNQVWDRFGKPIYVTENGCCDSGDDMRRKYLLSHLSQLHAAIEDGCDIRGYMQWTLMDNFEWREGFEKRFGLIEMDHDDPDLVRKPRPSAYMYQRIIEQNSLTDELVEEYSPGALDRWG